MEHGPPTSYLLLAEGTPVLAAGGERVGEVRRVLAVPDADVFDGLILETPEGERFVDADHVGALHERAAFLTLTREETRHLPEPSASPAAMEARPGEVDEGGLAASLRSAWDRISGNY